jgi:phage gpG-like protein
MSNIPEEFWDAYSNLGGEIVIEDISFAEAEIGIMELAGYIENTAAPMLAAQKIARDDMAKRFETETDPSNTKWLALDPDYAKRKEHEVGFEHPILTGKSRDLRTEAIKESAWVISGESLFFSTDGLPLYWRIHQEGSSDYGAHYHKATHEGNLSIEEIKKLGFAGEGDQNIPPRPFIGLSKEAQEKILNTFDLWFGLGVEKASRGFKVSSRGTLQEAGPKGQFGPKIIF